MISAFAVAERREEIKLLDECRVECGMTMKIRWQAAAISGAPPAPGNRTAGDAYDPMTVVLMFAKRLICAAPRKPTVIRPLGSQ